MAIVVNGQNVYQLTDTGDGRPQDTEKARREMGFPPADGTAHDKSPDKKIITGQPSNGTS